MNEVNASSKGQCATCYEVDVEVLQCARCKITNYCSKECQTKDWKSHKVLCSPYTELKRGQPLLDTLDMGIEIGLDLAKFAARWEKFERQSNESDSDDESALLEYETKLQNEYITSNPWPSERTILDFINNEDGRYTHRSPYIKNYGPKYYNHSLAKELYEAGSLMDGVAERTKFRRVGWKIKAYGESITGTNDQGEILECMRAYLYILNHVICGGEILPVPKPPPGSWVHPIFSMKIIEFAWDDVGQWKV